MTADDTKLLDASHDYDGIQEHDNPAPLWLTRTFIGCIVFAAAYFAWFHIADKGTTPQEDFAVSWKDYQDMRTQVAQSQVVPVDEATLAMDAQSPDVLAHGREVFAARCTGCHTADGRGLVGPNLTDDFQIHGKTRLDIYNTVSGGVQEKGMPAWLEQLPQPDVVAVASFVTTLRGTNVPGGKAPQGDRVGKFAQ
jgi:cytochrome c oxidase cbb3-type subunit 3